MIRIQELIKHFVLGIVSLLLLHGTMDQYGKHRDFLKKIRNVQSQYNPDSFEAKLDEDFIMTIATTETGNFNFEGADTKEEQIIFLVYKHKEMKILYYHKIQIKKLKLEYLIIQKIV